MGIDVVSVGLRHTLRVYEPLLLFEDISTRYNANIKVIYFHSTRNHSVNKLTLLYLKKEGATINLTIEPPKCQYLQRKTSPKASSVEINWQSKSLKKQLWDAMCNDYGNYDVKNNKLHYKYLNIRVFRETADIDIYAPFRWFGLVDYFRSNFDNISRLQDYRKNIYKHTQLLGCDEAIYFGDQYEYENIFLQIDKPVNVLLKYIDNREYYNILEESDKPIKLQPVKASGPHPLSRFDVDWEIDNVQYSRLLDIPDFIMNKRNNVPNNCIIDVLFDDFRDLKEDANQ